MEWSTPLDLYCERIDASFWSEPVNALSNIAFLIAAALAFELWRRGDRSDGPALALIIVVAVVGAGSFVFHTVATLAADRESGAILADVIPIAVFIYGYLLLALRRFLHLRAATAAAIVVAYAASAQALSALAPPRPLNGSVGYLPALAALIAVALVAKEPSTRRSLALAALVFAVSLGLRTVDNAICPQFPLGTHFTWHILNAVVLYVLLRTAVMARRGGSVRNLQTSR
jgi:Ceramidase